MADARAKGVGRGRTSARDLARPFHGVRATSTPDTPLLRVRALVPRLGPEQLIGGVTALHVWGYPGPAPWALDDDIVVVVPTDAVRPRTRGVKSLRVARGRVRRWKVDGIPISDPVSAMFIAARDLTDDQLVIVLDALLTRASNYPDLLPSRPLITRAEIERRLREWGRFDGCKRVREALERAREDVESPKETQTRLLLISCGLPEPTVQHIVRDRGRFVARVDLAYPAFKIAIEYEGDGHRRSKKQWRRDIQRQRELEDLGWIVIRVTELDLRDDGVALLRRIRRAIASR